MQENSPDFLDDRVSVALIVGIPGRGHEGDDTEEVEKDLVGGLHFDAERYDEYCVYDKA